jgi:hypothetical protein
VKEAIILALGSALLVVVALACTSLAPADAGGGCASPSSGQAGCVLPILAKGIAGPWDVALTTAGNACGVSKDVASSIWAAHTQAEVLEGFVPRAIGTDGGIKP